MENIIKKFRILLVEDDPLVRKVHLLMLTNLNKVSQYELVIDVAEDGFIALELIKKNTYMLIFMDIGLPGLSGIEVIKEIRKLDNNHNNIPIIALTAYTKNYHEEAKNVGANDVFTKPIKIEDLKKIVNTYIASS